MKLHLKLFYLTNCWYINESVFGSYFTVSEYTNKLIQIAFVLCLLVVKYLTAKIQIPDIQSVNGFL